MLGLFLSSPAWAAKVLVLEDNFDGSSLSNIWIVMKPEGAGATVSGGVLTTPGNTKLRTINQYDPSTTTPLTIEMRCKVASAGWGSICTRADNTLSTVGNFNEINYGIRTYYYLRNLGFLLKNNGIWPWVGAGTGASFSSSPTTEWFDFVIYDTGTRLTATFTEVAHPLNTMTAVCETNYNDVNSFVWIQSTEGVDWIRIYQGDLDLGLPEIGNIGSQNRTDHSADVVGRLLTNGTSSATVSVYWSTNDCTTNAAAWTTQGSVSNLGSLADGTTVTNTLTDLSSNTTYYWNYSASNASCTVWGATTGSPSFLMGSVWVEALSPTATYGRSSAFIVNRPVTATNGALTVRYTLSGSASNGLDYANLSNAVMIADGATNAVLPVIPVQDMDLADEDVVLTLVPGNYATGALNQATVTLTPWSGVTAQTGNWYVAVNGNDTWAGTNWATAFASISNGVGHATNGQSVLVGTGTYTISNQIVVASNITLLGVTGARKTIVTRDPAYNCRILAITHSSATVDGFTLTNGYENTTAPGGGVSMAGGKLLNCLITGNTDSHPGGRSYGGGIHASGGVISNCIIRGNSSVNAYGKAGGLNVNNTVVQGCLVEGNYASEYPPNGGLLAAGASRVENCLFRANNGCAALAAGSTLIRNCTIVESTGGNTALYLEGWSVALNCIAYFNVAPDAGVGGSAVMQYSCAANLTSGTGNITNNPLFVNRAGGDFHLSSSSPCIDVGLNGTWAATDTDYDGYLRILHSRTDMGAFETRGSFGCNFVSDKTTGFAPLTNILTSYVSGTNLASLYYAWDVNADGIVEQQGFDKQIITNIYTLPGLYSVALMVSNAIGQVDAFTNLNYISVSTDSMYVSPAGANTLPYSSWATAATTLQAAVSFAADGTTIFITNATYVLNDTVVLPLSITLKSVNGAGVTTIDGNGFKPCFLLNNAGAVLDGLTISNGYSSIDGGGMTVSAGTVQNCVIRNNKVGRYGGGVYLSNGTLKNCVIFGNASLGSTAPLASSGGGVYMLNGTVMNCTIAGNTAVRGAASGGDGLTMAGGTVSNSIVYFNSVFPYTQYQRNVYKTGGTFVYSCTIPAVAGAGNTAADPQFVDRLAGNYRLLPGSPCIDRGTNIVGLITDLDGASRPLDGDTLAGEIVDMGAYEAEAINAGAFRCNFVAVTNEGINALSNVVFNAYVAGAVTNVQSYYWDFTDDGVVDSSGGDQNPVSNTFGVGFYTVKLTVTNTSAEGSAVVKPGYIRVASPALYVSTNGSATLPYDTWAKAATNLNAAIEAAYTVGCTQQVLVTNGQYGLDRQLELLRPILLTGVGGASNIVAFRTGAYAHRIAYMTHAASVIDGLTLTNGYENTEDPGGGVLMSAGSLQNCIVVKNTDTEPYAGRPWGGGVYALGGVISNCAILNNLSDGYFGKAGGVGAINTVIQRCLIEGNVAYENFGGGLLLRGANRVENCLIRKNNKNAVMISSGNQTLLRNCTVVENTGGQAIWIESNSSSCTGVNCIAYNNTAPDIANDSASSVIQYSCALSLTHGVNGNITNNPLFVNQAAGDFRLQVQSPCFDSGLNGGWTRADVDLDGKSRLFNGLVDRGAYETRANIGTSFILR